MGGRVLISTLTGDFHTQGLFNFTRIAREAGYEVTALPPGSSPEEILRNIQALDPSHVGFSYRLSPKVGLDQMSSLMSQVSENGLLLRPGGGHRHFAFAGLPATVDLVLGSLGKYKLFGIKQAVDPLASVGTVLDYLAVTDKRRGEILESARARLMPPRIELLDHLADLVASDSSIEPPLPTPSEEARRSYTRRILEAWPRRPILRTHYGEPGDSIAPTIHGIRVLAEARVIDELSLGSSDLSQRYYNRPDQWQGRKNDGGVPYKDFQDLTALREAARAGNFPAVKPYSHVVDMEEFVDECLRAGMLTGGHQAVPLFWFNQLDGRGPADVLSSIREHCRAVAKLAREGIPVEMNDPNHWSSRWASDAVVVADYGLIASVMLTNGVKDLVLQMQFNKPKETSDFGDLAKFLAARDLVNLLLPGAPSAGLWIETRSGIDHFEPDLEVARKQLARTTLLQMALEPHAIHLVSYCEALYAARPDDIIKSSSVIRKAVNVYHQHKEDVQRQVSAPLIQERRKELLREAQTLLREIARLNPALAGKSVALQELPPYLAVPETLYQSLNQGHMCAPGIFTEPFGRKAARAHTDIFTNGFINSMDPKTLKAITEEERLRIILN